MPHEWFVRLLLRPVECIELLLEESAARESDYWKQQEIIKRWHEGGHLIAEILNYWREDPGTRYAFTRVCVVDYAMPAMSGLQVLSELSSWTGSRVLLTGRVEEQLAVSAFNRGLIERFVPKQSPDIRARLSVTIQELLDMPESRLEQVWRATLGREQYDLLSDPAVSKSLAGIAIQESWVEHFVIGAPFGVVALDKNGDVSWLQLEPESKLPELAEIAESQGWSSDAVSDIRAGRKLIDLELRVQIGASHQPQAMPATVIGSGGLLASLFRLSGSSVAGPFFSHERFIAEKGERLLQE